MLENQFGTVENFRQLFRQEGVNVGWKAVSSRIETAKQKGKITVVSGERQKTRRVLRGASYYETEVREACADLFKKLPQADENGFLRIGYKLYGTKKSLARRLSVSASAIESRILDSSLEPIQGRDKQGHIHDFYSLSAVRRLCGALAAKDLPQADEDGFIEIKGRTYGTVYSLPQMFDISEPTVRSKIRDGSLRSIKGKDRAGCVRDFYPVSRVYKLCGPLAQKLPQADEDGCLKMGGEVYRTRNGLAKHFGISRDIIGFKIREHSLMPIKGKYRGRIRDFYSVAEVLKLCIY